MPRRGDGIGRRQQAGGSARDRHHPGLIGLDHRGLAWVGADEVAYTLRQDDGLEGSRDGHWHLHRGVTVDIDDRELRAVPRQVVWLCPCAGALHLGAGSLLGGGALIERVQGLIDANRK
jgi:hypothetical protein